MLCSNVSAPNSSLTTWIAMMLSCSLQNSSSWPKNCCGVTLPMPVLLSLSWSMWPPSLIEFARAFGNIDDDVLDLGEGQHGLERVFAAVTAGLGAAERGP